MAPEKPPLPQMDDTDRRIVNALQEGFPIVDAPYRQVAGELGIAEDDLLARLERLLQERILTRFGPLFQIERAGGRFVLAAMAVPEADFERVAAAVNALPQVAHNYRREHALNMWFVLATEQPDEVAAAIVRIENATGLPVFAFPKEREFFVGMKLDA
jgi:DNA-binding Lrp family transcriptional regulator